MASAFASCFPSVHLSHGPTGVGATAMRRALPTPTQVDRPGHIAGVTQLSTPGAGLGVGGAGALRDVGQLKGLSEPASFFCSDLAL